MFTIIPPFVYIIIGVIAFIFVLLIALIILLNILNRRRIKNMFTNVYNLLNQIVNLDKDNSELNRIEYDLKKNQKPPYDFVLKTEGYIYYIKVVDNHSGYEICVNNSVKWQIRKTFADESMNFVSDIEELMRMELPREDSTRIPKKLYIIYPGARSLLRYINECEMEFIHPTTDVYGTNIITYNDLKENIDFIPRKHVKKDKDKNTQLSLKI
ncbi:MAG: hypothetical protein IJS83_06850 [Acholeplasmatales bacterium]|nr:hypothetical protein [Acholeplasmatales bacterium]